MLVAFQNESGLIFDNVDKKQVLLKIADLLCDIFNCSEEAIEVYQEILVFNELDADSMLSASNSLNVRIS